MTEACACVLENYGMLANLDTDNDRYIDTSTDRQVREELTAPM